MNLARRAAMLIGAAAVLPLVIFFAIQLSFASRDQRRLVESRAMASVETLIVESDAQLSRTLGALDALATAAAIRQGDFALAYRRAAEIAALNPDWVSVALTDLSGGREMFDLRRPYGQPRAAVFRREPLPAGVAERAVVDGIGGSGRGCPCIVVHRRVRGPGGRDYLVTAEVAQRPFQNLVMTPASDPRPVALVDSHGRFVARSVRPEETVGGNPSQSLRDTLRSGRKGGIYASRTLEGFVSYTAFATSRLSGWSAHVAFDPTLIDAPHRRSLAATALAALAALLLATALIWFTLRQLKEAGRVERRIEEAQKMEALGQLTGGIAHDFNNLLTPIVGGLDMLARQPGLDGRPLRIVESALNSARKAAKLATQLLAFSRRQNLEVRSVDLPALIANIEPILRQSAGAAIDIEIRVDPGAGCVLSDPNQLELALLNLVVNARDAMPEGGTIRISAVPLPAREGSAEVELRIADTGKGMPPDVLRRATEPFFTTKPPGSGTGLGLAQVYGATRQAGGGFRIESEPGKGTVITLTLRGCDDPPPVAVPPRIDTKPAIQPERRILVCDDDDAARTFVAHSLEQSGYVVEHVSSGRTAVEAARNAPFDLVVCDFAMRGMNGAEVARRVRALERPVPFLLITGYADSDALAGIGVEIPVLRKPFDGDALAQAVRAALGDG